MKKLTVDFHVRRRLKWLSKQRKAQGYFYMCLIVFYDIRRTLTTLFFPYLIRIFPENFVEKFQNFEF